MFIAVFTAMDCEYQAVRLLLQKNGHTEIDKNGNQLGQILGIGGYHKVVLPPFNYGRDATSSSATSILKDFPTVNYLIFIGVAGGVPPSKAGDLVISQSVVDTDFAKLNPDGSVEQRGVPLQASGRLLSYVKSLQGNIDSTKPWWPNHIKKLLTYKYNDLAAKWHGLLLERAPVIRIGNIGSSMKIVNDSKVRDEWAKSRYRIKAFEMEGGGVATAANLFDKGWIIIRGISDASDGIRDDEVLQPYASRVAAAFLGALFERIPCNQETSAFNWQNPLNPSRTRMSPKAPLPNNQASLREHKIYATENLSEDLGVSWIKHRAPVVSSQLNKKIEYIAGLAQSGHKVVLLGKSAIGKTTLLYLISNELLKRKVPILNKFQSINQGVFIVDNLPRNLPLLGQLTTSNLGVVATSREVEWVNRPVETAGWREIEVTAEDYESNMLKEVLISALKERRIEYKNEGIEIAVRKSGGSPGYLVALSDYLKQSGLKLDELTASKVPSSMYSIEAEELAYAASDKLSVWVLYTLACTKKIRLHMNQIAILINLMKNENEKRNEENSKTNAWQHMAYRDHDLFMLPHETWKDLLLKNWKTALGVERAEPSCLIEARSMPISNILEKVLISSISCMSALNTESSLRLEQVILENRFDLAKDIVHLVYSDQSSFSKTMKPSILDIAAHMSPTVVKEWLQRLDTDKLYESRIDAHLAPNYTALLGPILLEKLQADTPNLFQRSKIEMTRVEVVRSELGVAYWQKGLSDEAIAQNKKALEICRDLLTDNPELYKPRLVEALNNQGIFYGDKGHLMDAITCLNEALEICRDLLTDNPELYKPDLAKTLNNLGNAFGDKGHLAEAITCLNEALEICRDLLTDNPELYKPDLAKTLNNLGNAFSDTGNKRYLVDAIAHLREALEVWRELVPADSELYKPDLADTLNNLGSAYIFNKCFEDAIACLREAVEVCRDLVVFDAERYRPRLSSALSNLGDALGDAEVKRVNDAITCLKEAVSINRNLVTVDPERFKPFLTWTLNSLGNAYRHNDAPDESIQYFQEALGVCRNLAAVDPERFKSDLAWELYNLGNAYRQKGQPDKGIPYLQEAKAIMDALVTVDKRFKVQLSFTVCALSLAFYNRNTKGDALTSKELLVEAETLLNDPVLISSPDHDDLASRITNLKASLGID